MNLFADIPETRLARTLDLTTLPPPPKWTPPDHLPELHGPTAIDVETRDPTLLTLGSASAFRHRKDAYVCGLSICTGNFTAYYPLRHEGGGNTELPVLEWLRAQARKPEVELIGANTPYDLAWLLGMGVDPVADPWDVQGMAALLDENRDAYSLESLGRSFLGQGKLELSGFLPGVKDILWQLPAAYVGPYGEQDAALTYRLWRVLRDKIKQEDLEEVSDLERPCLRIATEMRLRGVPYDLEGAERARRDMLEREEALVRAIKTDTGVNVTATDNEALGRACREVGLDPGTTAQGRTSITADWLEAQKHPLTTNIRELRRWNKARTSFVESHMAYAGIDAGRGRIHGEFHPLRRVEEEGSTSRGTVSGRFSGTDPNLQNIPARDPEVRKRVRTLFKAEHGAEWGAADYSSQEPRLTVHFAFMTRRDGEPLPGAADAVEAYAQNPRLDYHAMTAELMGVKRKEAKAINLGLTYGMGGAKLCRELGLPTMMRRDDRSGREWEAPGPEGERLLKLYNERVPFARMLSQMCQDRVNRVGFIRTLKGRKCHWPEPYPGEKQRPYSHKALNRLIQGSAADQMKAAMVMLWREYREVPLVTVHDELGFSSEGPEHLARIRHCMEDAVTLTVPTIVDLTTGPSWGDAKE